MYKSRTDIISNILSSLTIQDKDVTLPKVCYLSGGFGIGKSYIINEVKNRLVQSDYFDAIFFLNSLDHIKYLTEFAVKLFNRPVIRNHIINALPSESIYNAERFENIIYEIQLKNSELASEFSYVKKMVPNHIFQSTSSDAIIPSHFEELLPKKSERRMVAETECVVSESFIIDLIGYFYPITGELKIFEESLKNKSKPKILIIADNYDKFAGSINFWIFGSLLKYLSAAGFKDFVNYDVQLDNPEIKISDIINVSFLIGNRQTLASNLKTNAISNSEFTQIELEPLPDNEIKKFIETLKINYAENREFINDLTCGIPYVLDLFNEYIRLAYDSSDYSLIYNKAAEKIYSYRTEDERDWLRCACFLDEFDESGLKLFPFIAGNSAKAFEFLFHSGDLTIAGKNSGKITIRPEVSKFIKFSTKIESVTVAKEFEKISELNNRTSTLFCSMTEKESEVLRNLAYFRQFDTEFALPEYFGMEKQLAISMIYKYSLIFDKHDFTYSLKPQIFDLMKEYNKYFSPENNEEQFKKVELLWQNRLYQLKDKVINNNSEINLLNKKYDELREDLNHLEVEKIGMNQSIDVIDVESKALEQSCQNQKKSRFIKYMLFILCGIILLFFGHSTEKVFQLLSFKWLSIYHSAYLIISLSLISYGLIFWYLNRIGKINSNKSLQSPTIKEKNKESKIINENLNLLEERIKTVKDNLEMTKKNMELLSKDNFEIEQKAKASYL
ncbi:MAG: hypothetical protein HW421_526 [Ignavibacteria bacterium]|nr:hypothetical protein [Ignavibacteria bacterium]